ncbi:hypothetical protein BCV70DRAFT_173829 [Testicularia cyperi]|uniref:Methyltransferase domain-containing protein n=1 Tax=Testicularia cyperi TaxID=1882483 RepID=A0A317XT01_9BASI|nr:hypothetical protein BCV70DRAFT_173829 [Testicularia cyperi]
MMDPYHVFLARGASMRSNDRKTSGGAAAKQTTGPTSGNSAASSQPSSSKQPTAEYASGVSLSPSSTISTEIATKSSAGSSSASSIAHRLPEFEHFRQSSPLMPEFLPRTSDFFSQGRRRSLAPTDAGNASASTAGTSPASNTANAASSRSGSDTLRKASPQRSTDKFELPLTFTEPDLLKGEQLPVRLGLAPPSHPLQGPMLPDTKYKTRVGFGYYFYTPPPSHQPTAASAATAIAVGDDGKRRTSASDLSVATSRLSRGSSGLSSGFTTMSSTLTSPDSPASALSDRSSMLNSADSSLPHKVLQPSGRSATSSSVAPHRSNSNVSSVKRPPPSPDCWRPESYFNVTRSRVKGRVREFAHHAFPASQVPYWLGYNKETIDAELATHLNVGLSLHGHTLRSFPEGARPCRVLDIGCGRGAWCLDMAREWKTSEFVGVDIAPVQPSLSQLSDPDMEQRVTWVIANFLEPLPFPDASFDFVHMRFLAQAIPEDKWVDVLSEARRILAPGGVLECIEGNHIFFGHASLVDAQEVKDLESGRAATKPGQRLKLPKRLKVLRDGSESLDIDAIEVMVERMMHRRFINPSPLSVIPSMLLMPGFSSVANGNPRHLPVYAESSAQRAKTRAREASSSSATATSSEDESKWKGKFTNRTQLGKQLNSQFTLPDNDLFSAFNITQNLEYISSARELLWQEAEEEKSGLRGLPQPELKPWDHTRGFAQGHPVAMQPFAHPWKTKDQFYRALDAYIEAMIAVTDMDFILDKYLGWEQGSEELTVEGRKHAERQRKMSAPAVHPSLGLDPSLSTEADEAEGRAAHGGAGTEGGGGATTSASSSISQEAPARMQTATGSSASLDSERTAIEHRESRSHSTNSDGNVHDTTTSSNPKAPEKKKRSLTGRPRSSGGVLGGNTSSGGSKGGRTFGRGGVGGGSVPLPLPDAPSFISGYAFGSLAADPKVMFGGPVQKAAVLPASRSKSFSSGPSLSDRSSITSGKTEKDRDRARGPPAFPAASSASTASSADHSTAASSQTIGHGARPSAASLSDSRSVSMPAGASHPTSTAPTRSVNSGGHTVRIAEPTSSTATSSGTKAPSRSKGNKSNTSVAMLGFYDCTGFLAIA